MLIGGSAVGRALSAILRVGDGPWGVAGREGGMVVGVGPSVRKLTCPPSRLQGGVGVGTVFSQRMPFLRNGSLGTGGQRLKEAPEVGEHRGWVQ